MYWNKNGGEYQRGTRKNSEIYFRVLVDLKQRSIQQQNNERAMTIRDIAKKNFISVGLVLKIQINRATTDTYIFKQRGGNRRSKKASPIILQYMKFLLELNPLWQLKQIQYIIVHTFNIKLSISYIHKIIRQDLKLKRRRISHIAKKRASIRIKTWRKAFADYAKGLDPFKLVFFDESYFTFQDALPKYAYVEKSNAIQLPIQKVSRKRFSLLAAMSATSILHWEIVDTTTGVL